MHLIGNALNGKYLADVIRSADRPELEQIQGAVAYVNAVTELSDLADRRRVPLVLFALADGGGWPSVPVLKRFVTHPQPSRQLFLTQRFYHPKILWFRGVGAYIGSANLTDGGFIRNLECGVWLQQSDLDRNGWIEPLLSMFEVVRTRSTPASAEHVAIYERLAKSRKNLLEFERRYNELVVRELASVPGTEAPIDPIAAKKPGGIAKASFKRQWNDGLTILRKMTQMMASVPQPPWVNAGVHPAILQDQATERWYHENIRRSGESQERISQLHEANRNAPDAAVERIFAEWTQLPVNDHLIHYVNQAPAELTVLLQPDSIAGLNHESLTRILQLAHAPREHTRQIRNVELGLSPDASTSMEERGKLYARLLLAARSGAGHDVRDLLQYVIWGDESEQDCAERLWVGTQSEEWCIPHLGINSLGELIGYVRPDEFPPRNGRVSKTLVALGFEGLQF